MLSESQREQVVDSLAQILPAREKLAPLFFEELLRERPNYRRFFSDAAIEREPRFVQLIEQGAASLKGESDAQDLFLLTLAKGSEERDLLNRSEDFLAPIVKHWQLAIKDRHDRPWTSQLEQAWTAMSDAIVIALKLGAAYPRATQVETKKGSSSAPQEKILAGELAPFGISSLLEAASLSRLPIALKLWDKEGEASGELQIRAGQVRVAECQGEGGLPAIRLLLRRPHHRFAIERLAKTTEAEGAASIVSLFDLVEREERPEAASASLRTAPGEPIDSSQEKAEVQHYSDEDDEDDDAPRSGIPTPVMTPIPLQAVEPLRRGSRGAEHLPELQALELRACRRGWVSELEKLPQLRAMILLEHPQAKEGEFWSCDGAQISIAMLGEFCQACVLAQLRLPQFREEHDPVGYRMTMEHRLGCIVADVDESGLLRICLFDPATPLAIVRHSVRGLIALSRPEAQAKRDA